MKSIFHNSFLNSLGSASSWRSAGSLNSAMAVSPSAGLFVSHFVESFCTPSSWTKLGPSVCLTLESDGTGAGFSPILQYISGQWVVYGDAVCKEKSIYISQPVSIMQKLIQCNKSGYSLPFHIPFFFIPRVCQTSTSPSAIAKVSSTPGSPT